MNENEGLPINRVVKRLTDLHVQWFTLVSVAVLVGTYSNSLGSLAVIKDKTHNPIYQYFNIVFLTIDLLFILNIYRHLIVDEIPKILSIRPEQEDGEIRYTNTLTSFGTMKIQLYSSWRTPLRVMSYIAYVYFWFAVQNSFMVNLDYNSICFQSDLCFGLGVIYWAAIALLFFVVLIELPIVYIYNEIKDIIGTTDVVAETDMSYFKNE